MKIEILDDAEQDLIAGFEFYERQSEGLGSNSICFSFRLCLLRSLI